MLNRREIYTLCLGTLAEPSHVAALGDIWMELGRQGGREEEERRSTL